MPMSISSGYELRDAVGRRLFSLQGDFAEKAVNVLGAGGQPVCTTERCLLPLNHRSHYQVRIAPGTDAGLVLCGLLALDKLASHGVGSGASTLRRQPVCGRDFISDIDSARAGAAVR